MTLRDELLLRATKALLKNLELNFGTYHDQMVPNLTSLGLLLSASEEELVNCKDNLTRVEAILQQRTSIPMEERLALRIRALFFTDPELQDHKAVQ